MKNMRHVLLILFSALLLAALASGCSRDPEVRKRKYTESGDKYFEKEKYREAAIQYLNAIQVDSGFAEAHYKLAQCYLKMSVWTGAYQQLTRTVDLDPGNLKAQIELGNLLLAAREFKRALEIAEQVLLKEPKNVDALILRANAEAATENIDASLRSMQEAIQLAPDRPRSFLNLALLQLSAKQVAKAEESFQRAVQLDPKSVSARLALANFYLSQKRFADAESQMRQAQDVEPGNHLPYAALARLYVNQGQRDKAEQLLRDAKSKLGENPEGYRLLADFYFALGEMEKALQEFAALYHQHPKDLRIKKNYVQMLILANRLDEATALNDEVLKENPKDVDALIHRGQVLNRRGKPNDAAQVLESALKIESDNAVAHYHLGAAYAGQGNLARAEASWREAVRLRPNMSAAHQSLATLAASRGDVQQLASNAEQMISSDPFNPDGFLLRAASRFARGDMAGGEADLKRAGDLAPRSPAPLARLGQVRAFQKRYPEAVLLFEQALERDPGNGEAMQGLITALVAQKQVPRALTRLQQQLAKVPQSSSLHFLLGNLYREPALNDLEKAEQAFAKAVELNKNFLEAFILLAEVQVQRGGVERAVATYERAIAENPRDVRGYMMLGSLEESRRKNYPRARELYEKALQVQPDYPLAANNLAYLLLETGGNVDMALSYAQVARRGLPNLPNVADTLAWAFYHKGFYSQAVPLLEEAVKSAEANPTYHFHLGLALQKLGEKTRARVHLQRALDLKLASPNAEKAEAAIRELGG